MSQVKDNIVITGLSGKLGKQIVLRQWNGATFLSKAPVKNHSSRKKEMYEKNRLLFKEAVSYAKKAVKDPNMKQGYQSKCSVRQNAFTRAVQDFLNAPRIGDVELSDRTGDTGGFIRIHATDDFRVKEVRVRIEDKQGNRIETGFADREDDTDWWKYVTSIQHPLHESGKVIVTAYDLPGNEAVREIAS